MPFPALPPQSEFYKPLPPRRFDLRRVLLLPVMEGVCLGLGLLAMLRLA